MIVISKAHRFSSNQGKVGWQDRTIPKRKKKHPSFRPSNGSFVTTINEATSKYLRRRVWEREAKSSRFQTNIEISGVESWLGPSSTTNGSGKLGLETIHLVHFQNYGEQELLPPREISHGILEPSSSSSSSSSRMDASRWFIERKFRFALLSYPFNCSPPSSWGSGRIWCKVFGEKLRRGKKWFAVFDRVIITGGKCGDLFRNTLILWREFSLGKLGPPLYGEFVSKKSWFLLENLFWWNVGRGPFQEFNTETSFKYIFRKRIFREFKRFDSLRRIIFTFNFACF